MRRRARARSRARRPPRALRRGTAENPSRFPPLNPVREWLELHVGLLSDTFHWAPPARCGAFADEHPVVGGDEGREKRNMKVRAHRNDESGRSNGLAPLSTGAPIATFCRAAPARRGAFAGDGASWWATKAGVRTRSDHPGLLGRAAFEARGGVRFYAQITAGHSSQNLIRARPTTSRL